MSQGLKRRQRRAIKSRMWDQSSVDENGDSTHNPCDPPVSAIHNNKTAHAAVRSQLAAWVAPCQILVIIRNSFRVVCVPTFRISQLEDCTQSMSPIRNFEQLFRASEQD
jgi:hypothetical protein